MAIEVVDFPIFMVIFPSYVNIYQRVNNCVTYLSKRRMLHDFAIKYAALSSKDRDVSI